VQHTQQLKPENKAHIADNTTKMYQKHVSYACGLVSVSASNYSFFILVSDLQVNSHKFLNIYLILSLTDKNLDPRFKLKGNKLIWVNQ
jgi:hypothetical protein